MIFLTTLEERKMQLVKVEVAYAIIEGESVTLESTLTLGENDEVKYKEAKE